MSRNKIYEDVKYEGLIDTSKWLNVFADNLNEKDKDTYLKRKMAVDMYLNDDPIKDIVEKTGVSKNMPRRLTLRCLELDENGMPYGYTALIPNRRIKTSKREFLKLLEEYPPLEELIHQEYLNMNRKKNKNKVYEKKITPKYIHKHFLIKCKELGIKETEYPFNTTELAKRSLYTYLSSLKDKYYDLYVYRCGEKAQQKLKSIGIGEQNNPVIDRPFQKVEFDGHKIDAMVAVKFKTLEGDVKTEVMSRIWLLTIIDVSTRVVLGYHICLQDEYSQEDVLRCIQNAIRPKEKMTFNIPGLKYPENGGFHSLCIPESEWAIWDEFSCDNAKSHLAKNVLEKLSKLVKCTITFGPVATPERRGLQERLFRTLEENSYHRLPSTTGSNINDSRRDKNCEKNAIKFEISESDIEELTEIVIAQYNNTPHSGISQFTPLELMKQRIEERGLVPHIVPEYERDNMNFLTLTDKRVVRGDKENGRRPFINYYGVTYTSDILARSFNLIGSELTLVVNLEDIRMIRAYLTDGSELGLLKAHGKWSIKKHSLRTRKVINKLINKKEIYMNQDDDPIDIYYDYLTNKALTKKSARNKLASLQKIEKEENDNLNKNNLEDTPSMNEVKNKSDISDIKKSENRWDEQYNIKMKLIKNTDKEEYGSKVRKFKPLNF